MRRTLLLIGLLPAALVAPAALSDEQGAAFAVGWASVGTVVVPRLTDTIRLDGVVDESAWEAVVPLPLVTHRPAPGDAPTYATEVVEVR